MQEIKQDNIGNKSVKAIVPLKELFVYPGENKILLIGRSFSINAINQALKEDGYIIVTKQKDLLNVEITPEDLYDYGVLCQITETTNPYPDSYRVSFLGMNRIKLSNIQFNNNVFTANYEIQDENINDIKLNALKSICISKINELKLKSDSQELLDSVLSILNIDNANTMVFSLLLRLIDNDEERSALMPKALDEILEYICNLLQEKIYILDIEQKIENKAKENIDKKHKEFWLKEKIDALKKELKETDNPQDELMVLKNVKKEEFSEEAWNVWNNEFKKLLQLNPGTQEYQVIKNYMEWIRSIPWNISSPINEDLLNVKTQLDESHFGLEDVKQRILEHVCVHMVNKEISPQTMLLVGPPGVGKTSIAISIAQALKLPYYIISLAGMSDSSKLLGQMRTYVGALPGSIVNALKFLKAKNGIIILDEVDKINKSHKDPSQVLVAILDPQQNNQFRDIYMDIAIDLSKHLFILTANSTNDIAPEIQDRTNKINLSGYTDNEKVSIFNKMLIKEQKYHCLDDTNFSIEEICKNTIIHKYTFESGARSLWRHIKRLCNRALFDLKTTEKKKIDVNMENLEYYLDSEPYEKSGIIPSVGVCRGLAWTYIGGSVLYIETKSMPGTGKINFTGNLGAVMKESIEVAINYIKSKYKEFEIDLDFFKNNDMVVHVPSGATPKDGPSAGVTIFSALISLIKNKPIRQDIAMTGEICLSGKILPIGGLKEKLIAASREYEQINKKITVFIPKNNTIKKIPAELFQFIDVVHLETIDELYEQIFA
jgi:ATP-dependent Lon protease